MVTKGIEESLKNICTIENDEYKELYSTWTLNKDSIIYILNNVVKDYPHYSIHDATHSEKVLANIEMVLGNDGIKKMSPTDMWLILHAVYFHDSGMVINNEDIHDFWRNPNFKNFIENCLDVSDDSIKKSAELILNFDLDKNNNSFEWALEIKSAVILLNSYYFRSKHGDISKKYVKNSSIWGIDLGHHGLVQKRLVKLVGEICVLHNYEFENIMSLPLISNGFKTDYIHPRFIACLLRLGDVLEMDNSRFNPFVDVIYGKLPKTSATHRDKHESTTHILITSDKIEIAADCTSDDTYRETANWFDLIQTEIEKLQLNWNDIAPDNFERAPKLAPPQILINGKSDIIGFKDLKPEISQDIAFKLIQGASFYKDKFVCIREVIQNAEDASKIQMWRDIVNGRYYGEGGIDKNKVETKKLMPYDIPKYIYDFYTITASVEKADGSNDVYVKIVDKGTGISAEKLKRMFNVGTSYHGSDIEKNEIADMPDWLRPTGSFGIGLQSCFLLTDSVTINTKAEGDEPMEVKLYSTINNKYPVVKAIGRNERGTEVSFQVSNETSFSFGIQGYVFEQLSHLDPFKSDEQVIYKIIETIANNSNNSLFPILLSSAVLDYNETLRMSDKIVKQDEWKYEKNIHWRFIDHRMICWYNSNYYEISVSGDLYERRLNILFKGKQVNNTNISSLLGIKMVVDIYGMRTEDTLTLNRDELKNSAKEKIINDIENVLEFYFYKTLYCGNIDSKYICNYILCASIYSRKGFKKEFKPNELNKKIKTDNDIIFEVLKKVDGGFERKKMKFSEMLFDFPCLTYVEKAFIETSAFYPYNEKIDANDICSSLGNATNIDKSYIIYDERLVNILSRWDSTLIYLPTKYNKNIRIYTVFDDNNKMVITDDEYTKQIMLKNLICVNVNNITNNLYKQRMCIPAISDYEALYVNTPERMLGYVEYFKYYIISPLTLDDKSKVEKMNKDLLIEYITRLNEFENLVKYVECNSINNASKEEIIDSYKRLICEYHKLFHESSKDICVQDENVKTD